MGGKSGYREEGGTRTHMYGPGVCIPLSLFALFFFSPAGTVWFLHEGLPGTKTTKLHETGGGGGNSSTGEKRSWDRAKPTNWKIPESTSRSNAHFIDPIVPLT